MIGFIREWMLVIAIVLGVLAYFIYYALPLPEGVHLFTAGAVSVCQPLLIFAMLFLTFCRVNPKHLRPCRWHVWALLVQGGVFSLLALPLLLVPAGSGARVIIEGAMLCMICPTATAAAVVTRKLGGDVPHVTSYTMLINLLCALIVPLIVPAVHPHPNLNFINAALLILGKVFPLLLLPLVAALLLRWLLPPVCRYLASLADLPFYLWAVALMLAISVTTRSIVHSDFGIGTELWLVFVSLVTCAFQFWIGKRIGARFHDATTAGQALGQKNTVLAIWMGYTFFTPVTSMVGGFYSIWHNLYNTYQLHRHTVGTR